MTSTSAPATDGPTGPTATILEAVVRMRCISATYNRKRMILAPHIAYLRAGGLYIDALVVSRENMLPREEKFGTFKIDGLSEVAITQRDFAPSNLFDPSLDKYATAVMMIEPEAVAA
ncbi:MAG: hypothetical protein EOP62_19090 [Sphingomonadales bacterium]|nr:MAG: hypothetical protein EOP62_19090 [Sphingomonadales bacterium]